MRVLLDLRPALAGRAGIPQECRLLHWGLSQHTDLQVAGLLQSGHAVLPLAGLSEVAASAVLAALQARRPGRWATLWRALPTLMPAWRVDSPGTKPVRVTGELDARQWWPHLFGLTLEPALASGDLELLALPWPWMAAHAWGLAMRAAGASGYPRIDTEGFDVVIAQTPYPGRVTRQTVLVVRYHDAVPVLMTGTTRSGRFDAAAHLQALRQNVRDGAWFACVSEAARAQLGQVCPEAVPRSVVIPNILAPAYRRTASDAEAAQVLIQKRGSSADGTPPAVPGKPQAPPPFLLAVSTIEPRKNHLRLLEAWEQLRRAGHPDLQLVLVGGLGWKHELVQERLRPWVQSGQAHRLENVDSDDLRMLYATAAATVCPALDEGFGYSALESLASGGVVVASDIPAHREVCHEAAVYFDPLDVTGMVNALASVLALPAAAQEHLRTMHGPARAARFQVGPLSKQWQEWLSTLR